jgi:zinc finger protein 830
MIYRELIMDRLMAEEAAQEEADMKVTLMKGRLEALRKARESARLHRITTSRTQNQEDRST